MLPQNFTPSLVGLIAPECVDDAAVRITECCSNGMEGLVGVLFANYDQLKAAMYESGWLFDEKKKPIKNSTSVTYQAHITNRNNGAVHLLVINCMGDPARILNCVEVSGATHAPEMPEPRQTPTEETPNESPDLDAIKRANKK